MGFTFTVRRIRLLALAGLFAVLGITLASFLFREPETSINRCKRSRCRKAPAAIPCTRLKRPRSPTSKRRARRSCKTFPSCSTEKRARGWIASPAANVNSTPAAVFCSSPGRSTCYWTLLFQGLGRTQSKLPRTRSISSPPASLLTRTPELLPQRRRCDSDSQQGRAFRRGRSTIRRSNCLYCNRRSNSRSGQGRTASKTAIRTATRTANRTEGQPEGWRRLFQIQMRKNHQTRKG